MEYANPSHSRSKEVELLSRVAANHIFLAQYEPLRAVLLSLRNRNPDLALSILRTIVLKAGRFDGVLWSSTCRSPSHLAWMAVLDLLDFENLSSSIGGFDHHMLRLKIEFLLLAQTLCDAVKEKDSHVFHRIRLILELGLRGLDSDVDRGKKVGSEEDLALEIALSDLHGVILDQADVFDVLCWNIHRQVNSFPEATELTIIAHGDVPENTVLSRGEFEELIKVQRIVQKTHLSALNKYIESGDLVSAISHIRYIHLDFGVDESEYRMVLKYLIKEIWIRKGGYEEAQSSFQNKMLLMYKEALSANCTQFLHIIEAIQDELPTDEIEKHQHIVLDNVPIPFPLQNYLMALNLGRTTGLDNQKFHTMIAHSCMGDMYQYARLSGAHILESVMKCALSAIKREQLQEACDVLSLFPLLQPLVAAMGWDLLSGKTSMRKKLLLTLWMGKSQAVRMEESSFYGKQSDEMSCVDYLCDLLCFHLDVASFAACVNSGHAWNSKDSILFSKGKMQKITCEKDFYRSDPFVENFVLERLAIQTPLRVLFDVVPGINFQDAIDIISMQPINSSSLAWKRLQDIELMHIRYALETAVLALGNMEKCVDEKDDHYYEAMRFLNNMKNHLEAVNNISRKVFTLSIIVSLIHMDNINISPTHCASSSSYYAAFEHPDLAAFCENGITMVVSFTSLLLDILHCSFQTIEVEQVHALNGAEDAGKQALKWRVTHIKCFIEDWNWRLSILQRLQPLSDRSWSWKEAMAVLCAAPSNLLNLCMQRAKYDIGEEAVHRFSLPPEDKAVLELTEWVASSFRSQLAEESVSRAAEDVSDSFQELDFSSLHHQLVPLVVVLLCIDVAVTSAKAADMCSRLLNEARRTLSKIHPQGSPKMHSTDWGQLKENVVIFVIQRVLQHLSLMEQEKACSFQEIFTGEVFLSPSKEPTKQGQRKHTIEILHQMIDDAHSGKRQFLSGKLHNLSRVVDEDLDNDKKKFSSLEKGVVLGLGLKPQASKKTTLTSTTDISLHANYNTNNTDKMLLGPLHSKPSTYISAFIIYIATIGDIVDGIDTTHDFNFFSIVYEWPKDLLTRLVFERGSTDAAAQIADIMCSDFVHEIISACVPPVFPPQSSHGWASAPLMYNLSNKTLDTISTKDGRAHSTVPFSVPRDVPLYSLELDIVKHLAKLSPVRAILACVFGSSILSSSWLSHMTDGFNENISQSPDIERMFYEFALDQSERFPTLNRWIQMQSNLRKVSESAIAGTSDAKAQGKVSVKRSREPECDTESEIDAISGVSFVSTNTGGDNAKDHAASDSCHESPKMADIELDSTSFLSLDWENEGPYEMAVERLIGEGKLMDALAISDRFLSNGASDHLLKLLIEEGDGIHFSPGESPSYEVHNLCSNTWQYCLRLKDKQLAAKIALKYLHHWELNAALDVLNMCLCHLSQCDPIRNEIWKLRQDLKKYSHILSAEESHTSWQGVETEYKEDPEGMALRLAGKGAVSAALEVAESAVLSIDLRRELQGRKLVKLLTEDHLYGGGPAEASRFLSSLPDPDDALPVTMDAMQLLPDLHSKKLLVHLFLKRRSGNLSDVEMSRLNSWALGLHVLAVLPLPWQQRCSSLHEHPQLILEVLLMMKQLHYASVVLKEFPSMRDDNLILTYCGKAIAVSVNSIPRESRISGSGSKISQKPRSNILSASLTNLQKEARRAFSWGRDTENKAFPKEAHRKRKSSIPMSSERVSWETMPAVQEELNSVYSTDGQERDLFVPVAEEWVLTGDPNKDDTVRSSHKFESSPDFVLFKGLLSLCSDEFVSTRGALELCVSQMKNVLSSHQLPLHASMEVISQAYHATEAFVQVLGYVKGQLKILAGVSDLSSNLERSMGVDSASSSETGSSSMGSQYLDELSELQTQAEIWFRRAELLQSLLGSGIAASLNDIADEESSECLRDRLIKDERYSMAVYTCKKCKIDGFPVWNAWGHALIRMKNYAQARVKFKQALQLHKGDPSLIIREIINTMEGGPPVDVLAVRSLYENLAESVATILDDSLSTDAYLNVLYMPRTEYADIPSQFSNSDYEDGPRSNLDGNRYLECIYYLQEFARPQMLPFMFQHGHYYDACLLFFPPNNVPSPTQHGTMSALSIPQRTDPLATDYGSIENLCDFCIGYDAMTVLEDILSTRTVSQDVVMANYIASALVRICNYCETHRHFNFLYKFQVIRDDNVAAGFCCIQLFMNSHSQEEAINHLSNAEMHFDEELSSRSHETSKIVSSGIRGKSVSGRFSAEGIVKLNTCLRHQVNVIKTFNDNEGPQWKHSLFGNPNDPETFRRRCQIAETLAEKNLDLVDGVIYNFNLPAVDIFAGVAATFAERKRSNLLTNLFTNIKSMIETDDLDQVLGAAINVYANKHKERPDKLIDMLSSSHRKVMACVVCGRLKSAFQIASRSGSVADVQYVAHQALHANAFPVLDMCKQWLAKYS